MVRKNFLIFVLVSIIVFTLNLNAYLNRTIIENNSLIEKVEFGQINWTKGLITIYGEKALPEIIKNDRTELIIEFPEKYAPNLVAARQIAKDIAYESARQNLYNALLNLRIKHDFYIKDYLTVHTTNDFRFQFNDFLLNRAKPKYIYRTNRIVAELNIKLYEKLNKVNEDKRFIIEPLNPHPNYKGYMKEKGIITIFTNDYVPELIPFFSVSNYSNYIQKAISTNNPVSQTYTSLIIDASELKKLKPALFPTIYSKSKDEVYSSKIIPKQKILKSGMVTYIPDISLINKFDFVDSGAFIIKAVASKNKTDLVLPEEELKQFLSSEKTVEYLQNCNVLVIINQ